MLKNTAADPKQNKVYCLFEFSAAISSNVVSCYMAPGEKMSKIISFLHIIKVIDRI